MTSESVKPGSKDGKHKNSGSADNGDTLSQRIVLILDLEFFTYHYSLTKNWHVSNICDSAVMLHEAITIFWIFIDHSE